MSDLHDIADSASDQVKAIVRSAMKRCETQKQMAAVATGVTIVALGALGGVVAAMNGNDPAAMSTRDIVSALFDLIDEAHSTHTHGGGADAVKR